MLSNSNSESVLLTASVSSRAAIVSKAETRPTMLQAEQSGGS